MTLINRPQFTPVEGKDHPDTGYNRLPSTQEIFPDEPIYTLWELNLTAPDSRSRRRYQIIIVNRPVDGESQKAQFVVDMGLAELYPVTPISVPGLWIETVASARDAADEYRLKLMHDEFGIEPTDIRTEFFDELELLDLQRRRVSQFGPLYKVERTL